MSPLKLLSLPMCGFFFSFSSIQVMVEDLLIYFAFLGLQVPGVPPAVVGVQQAMTAPVAIPLPTPCIMLLNMFDPTK